MPYEGGDPKPVMLSLRRACAVLPRLRFWWIVILSALAGFAVVVPFIYLISRDQVGAPGVLLDSFWHLFIPSLFLLVFLAELSEVRQTQRGQRLSASLKKLPGALFFLLIAALLLHGFVNNVRFHLQLKGLNAVSNVQVGCREIDTPKDVDRIAAAVRNARWFSPVGHGWSHDIPFTLKLKSGQELHYFLSHYLTKESAIIVSPAANPDRAASAELATILTQTGAWHATPKWSDYTHSYYNEMTVSSEGTCQLTQRR